MLLDMSVILYDIHSHFYTFPFFAKNLKDSLFVPELRLELGEDDPFFDGRVYAIYKCDANDDMLFQSVRKDGTELWRIYHLTYSHCRERDGFPIRRDFESGQKAAEYIINHFVEENESCGLKL